MGEAFRQQGRANDEDDREGQFSGDQNVLQPARAKGSRRAASITEGFDHAGSRRFPRGKQADQHGRQRHDNRGEQRNPRIDPDPLHLNEETGKAVLLRKSAAKVSDRQARQTVAHGAARSGEP
jgi:hypothetical protein